MADPAAFIAWMEEHARQRSYDLIIPMTDETLLPMSDERERLQLHATIALPPTDALATFVDKARTVELAGRLGVAFPASCLCASVDEIVEAAAQFGLPMALKPSRSVARSGNESRESLVVCYALTMEDCRALGAKLLKHGFVVAQEYVKGRGIGVELLCDHGEPILTFQHERLHEFPLTGGGSSLRRSVTVDADLLRQASALMRDVRWHGVAMVEFKVDRTSGKSWLMEVNGRFWGSLPLAVAAGADFPVALYELLVNGRRTVVTNHRIGIVGRSFSRDVKWLLAVLFRSDPSPLIEWPGRLGALLSWAGFILPKHRFDLQTITDPGPGWIEIKRTLQALYDRARHRLMRQKVMREARQLAANGHERERKLRDAKSLLFVCHGNINRSMLAEVDFRTRIKLAEGGPIASAGFHPRAGRPADPVTAKLASEVGLDLGKSRSRALSDQLVASSDLVIVMQSEQAVRIRQQYPGAHGKVVLLAALAGMPDALEIPDPYGESDEIYRDVFQHVRSAVARVATHWGERSNDQ